MNEIKGNKARSIKLMAVAWLAMAGLSAPSAASGGF